MNIAVLFTLKAPISAGAYFYTFTLTFNQKYQVNPPHSHPKLGYTQLSKKRFKKIGISPEGKCSKIPST
jgi:hypothetical protein